MWQHLCCMQWHIETIAVGRLFWPDCKPEGHPLFLVEFVCLSVCVSVTGTSTLQH